MISTPEEQQRGDEYLLNLFYTTEGIANPAPWYKTAGRYANISEF